MNHPDMCYSHDIDNNCIIIVWGESGYYRTDSPKGKYDDEVIDWMNERLDITPEMRRAMEICSKGAELNPNLDWEAYYRMIVEKGKLK